MKRFVMGLAASAAVIAMVPAANAAPIVNGATGVAPTPGVPAGQGTLLASQTTSGTALTFSATFYQAVYRNTSGTLDFYFQVLRTGAGSQGNEEIRSFTVSNFGGYFVDGYASAADPDLGGLFVAANNPFLDDGTTASGSTTTFGRAPSGNVLTTSFGANGLSRTENSATYIFRTNATQFNTGTFGIIDGSTLQGTTYQPTGPAVPEPATWGLMLLGFGAMGGMLRSRRRVATRIRFA